jgi:hypothetical protein
MSECERSAGMGTRRQGLSGRIPTTSGQDFAPRLTASVVVIPPASIGKKLNVIGTGEYGDAGSLTRYKK